jgi:hypothetical protein
MSIMNLSQDVEPATNLVTKDEARRIAAKHREAAGVGASTASAVSRHLARRASLAYADARINPTIAVPVWMPVGPIAAHVHWRRWSVARSRRRYTKQSSNGQSTKDAGRDGTAVTCMCRRREGGYW